LTLYIYRRRETAYLLFAISLFLAFARFLIETNGLNAYFQWLAIDKMGVIIYFALMHLHATSGVIFALYVFNKDFLLRHKTKFTVIFSVHAIVSTFLPIFTPAYIILAIITAPLISIFVIIVGIRSPVLKENSIMRLHLVAWFLFLFIGFTTKAFFDSLMFMTGLVLSLFLVMVQSMVLARRYTDALRFEEEARILAQEKVLLENLTRKKSELYGNISHEMKTPLTIIATDIQLAEQFMDEGNPESARELMREAWQETMQTANRVTDALAFARGQETSKPMEYIDFGEVIKTTLAVTLPLIKKQGNKLEQDIMKLPQIIGNTDMLAGALVNLLTNANRYTENGVISVRWEINNERYCLTVRDNGSGIPPEILPRVFERGVTDGSGTGLGLAIVKSVMELHGGDVSIESEVGKGTVVTLIFPVFTEENI